MQQINVYIDKWIIRRRVSFRKLRECYTVVILSVFGRKPKKSKLDGNLFAAFLLSSPGPGHYKKNE